MALYNKQGKAGYYSAKEAKQMAENIAVALGNLEGAAMIFELEDDKGSQEQYKKGAELLQALRNYEKIVPQEIRDRIAKRIPGADVKALEEKLRACRFPAARMT